MSKKQIAQIRSQKSTRTPAHTKKSTLHWPGVSSPAASALRNGATSRQREKISDILPVTNGANEPDIRGAALKKPPVATPRIPVITANSILQSS